MKRYRNDSLKPGKGIDENDGSRFGKTDDGNIANQYRGEDDSYSPAYKSQGDQWTSEKSGAIDWQRYEDRQFTYGTRDLWSDTNTNSGGGQSGPVTAGVSRSQTDGEKRRGGR